MKILYGTNLYETRAFQVQRVVGASPYSLVLLKKDCPILQATCLLFVGLCPRTRYGVVGANPYEGGAEP